MHACMCQCIMCAMCQFSPFVFKFQIKKIDCSTFSMVMHVGFYALKHLYAHIPMFLYVSYISMLEHLSILCVPMFLCSCKNMN